MSSGRITRTNHARWLRALVLATAAACLPLTASAAQEPHTIIVKFSHPGQGEEHRSERANQVLEEVSHQVGAQLRPVRTLASGSRLVEVKGNGIARAEAIRALRMRSDVEYAEVDGIAVPMATPNDTLYGNQWHYFESAGGVQLPIAWSVSTGAGARVAVLDTGYRPHTDLNANLLGSYGYDFISHDMHTADGNKRDSDARDPGDAVTANQCGENSPARASTWHGTHVAGTIAAVTNNSKGVAGVAYGAKILPIRVLGTCGGRASDVAEAIRWAAGDSITGVPANSKVVDVINLSLGGFHPLVDDGRDDHYVNPYDLTPPGELQDGVCPSEIKSAVSFARSRGVVVVGAAGNWDADASEYWPANCAGVIVVAGTDRDGGRWKESSYIGSNYGSVVDVAAPTGNTSTLSNGVLSTSNSGATTPASDNYEYLVGTSMATPHVSGIAALMLAINPGLTPDQVESTLKNTARSFPQSCAGCGTGIVNARAAVAVADKVNIHTEYTGCVGYGSKYLVDSSMSSGANGLEWDVDKQAYGSSTWSNYYAGSNSMVWPTIYEKTRFRVRGRTVAGWSSYRTTSWLLSPCTGGGGGGGGGGLDPY